MSAPIVAGASTLRPACHAVPTVSLGASAIRRVWVEGLGYWEEALDILTPGGVEEGW